MTNDELKIKLEEELDTVVQELADLGHEDVDATATEPDELADRRETVEEQSSDTGTRFERH